MRLLHLFLYLAIGFAVLVGAAPTPDFADEHPEVNEWELLNNTEVLSHNFSALGYDPSLEYHGYSVVEFWVGKLKVNVGSLEGVDLYKAVYLGIDELCPTFQWSAYSCWNPNGKHFDTITRGWTHMYGDGQWATRQVRSIMIDAIAGAVQYLVYRNENCHYSDGHRICHIPDVLRINLPPLYNYKNYLYIKFWNRKSEVGVFDCCNSRYLVDQEIDRLAPEVSDAFQHRPFQRDTKCIINGWEGCE